MRQIYLVVEFLILFFILPVSAAFFISPSFLFPGLLCFTLFGIILLQITSTFRWRSLWQDCTKFDWKALGWFSLFCLLIFSLITFLLIPEHFYDLPTHSLKLWILIMVAYPIISALPQELIFRPLFFIRYKSIFPNKKYLVIINAIAFCLAHLFYWNLVAITITFLGGLVFAYIYKKNRNFLEIVMYHSVGGCIIFTTGLGRFFYSGAIQ